MVSANLVNSLAQGGNPAAQAFTATTNELAMQRQRQFEQDQRQKQATSQDAIDAAIRESSMGPEPQTPQAQPPMIQSQDLTPGAPVVSSPLPAAVAPSSGLTATPTSYAGQTMQSQPQSAKLSPFDTPEFTANLQRRLATIPGAGNMIMQMRKDRDAQILKVMEMSAAGNTDEARFLAKQNGLELPDVIYQNGDVARAMTLSAKAYPDEPQKAQMFTQAFMSAQGGLQEKVNAGIRAGGTPTTASQRQLNNQITLLKWKAANPQYSVTDPYKRYQNVANVGLVDLGAPGGPTVVLQGQKMTYQQALQKNMETLAGQLGTSRSNEELFNEAKQLTDMVFQSQVPGGATQVVQPQAAPITGVSPGLLPPPSGQGTPDPRVFSAPVATPAPQVTNQPANTGAAQLQPTQTTGTITVRNPRSGEAFQIQPSDLGAAQAEGFEVVQ